MSQFEGFCLGGGEREIGGTGAIGRGELAKVHGTWDLKGGWHLCGNRVVGGRAVVSGDGSA